MARCTCPKLTLRMASTMSASTPTASRSSVLYCLLNRSKSHSSCSSLGCLWVGPSVFCAATEAIADMTQDKMNLNLDPWPHYQDKVANTPTPNPRPPSVPGQSLRIQHHCKAPLKKIDCYVENLVVLAQGSKQRLRCLRQTLFHCIDMVFCASNNGDDKWKIDPISLKKLLKKDGS